MVPLSAVTGRATFVVWPLKNAKLIAAASDLSKLTVTKK
jgi:hypothetical protein